jgi:hypothetical protein
MARVALPIPPEVRARAHSEVVVLDDGCWESRGKAKAHGYRSIYFEGKTYYAHRASWEFVNGPADPGMVIDHICYNRTCVNPSHLRQIDHAWNSRRQNGVEVPEDGCRWGHPMSARRKVRRGKWMVNVCWDCMDEHNRETTVIRQQLRLLEIAYGLGDWHTKRSYQSTVNARNERVMAVRDARLVGLPQDAGT